MDDVIFNIPYIYQIYNDPPLFALLPDHPRRHVWTFSIRYEEPIMDDYVADDLIQHQNMVRTNKISISLPQPKQSALYTLQ